MKFLFKFSSLLVPIILLLQCDAILPNLPGNVTVNPESGTYIDNVTISLSSSNYKGIIYYSLFGNNLELGPTAYTGNITLLADNSPVTIKMFSSPDALPKNLIGSATYKIISSFSAQIYDSSFSSNTYAEPILKRTSDGGVITAFATLESGNLDIVVLKLSNQFSIEWQFRYGGSNTEWASSLIETSGGGYVIAGKSRSFGTINGIEEDFFIFKLDINGNIVWQKSFEGTGTQCAFSIKELSTGDLLLVGRTNSFGALDDDFWITKCDTNGNILLETRIDSGDIDCAYTVAVASNGNYIVGGISGTDIWLISFSSYDYLIWQRSYSMPGVDYIDSIQCTPDGGFILLGQTNSFTINYAILLIKLNNLGAIEWSRLFSCSEYEQMQIRFEQSNNAMIPDENGGWCILGYAINTGNTDIFTLRINNTGLPDWLRTYSVSSSSIDGGYSIDKYSNGYIIIGQTGNSFIYGYPTMLLLNHDGLVQQSSCELKIPLIQITDISVSQITVANTVSLPIVTSSIVNDTTITRTPTSTNMYFF